MANTQTLIAEVYSAFNQRNIDGALAFMSENVSWPKASEGGRVIGKEEIRFYWSRQWKEFDPYVEPIEVIDRGAGKIDVRVHQLVKSLQGDVLSDSEVWHFYTIADGLIERMDIEASEAGAEQSASSAFSASLGVAGIAGLIELEANASTAHAHYSWFFAPMGRNAGVLASAIQF